MANKRSRKRRKQRAARSAAGPPPTADTPSVPGQAPEATSEPPTGSGGRPAAPRPGAPNDGPPPPPWGSFPLSEIVIFVGILFLLAGFFVPPPRGPVLLGAGLALASLGGLELSVREHFAGYRSHTVLLAGAAGMAVLGGLLVAKAGPAIAAGAAVLVFGLCAWLFATTFRRRSGGELFKIKG